jgi:hypothetical protein
VIIGVTDEKTELVDAFVAKRKPTYPIVILKTDALEKALKVPHFPFNGVIDPTGTLSYAGDSPQGALGDAMKVAKPGPIWPKKLLPAAQALRAQDLDGAWAQLELVAKDAALDARDTAVLGRFRAFVERSVADQLDAAKKSADAGFVYDAVQVLTPLAAAKALPARADAEQRLADLRALPKFDLELKGGEAFVAAAKLESSGEFSDAFDAFKGLSKKYAAAKIGPLAFARAKSLVDRGLPGYKSTCPKCQAARKACAKHAEDVKL